jgi:hypothetical protein
MAIVPSVLCISHSTISSNFSTERRHWSRKRSELNVLITTEIFIAFGFLAVFFRKRDADGRSFSGLFVRNSLTVRRRARSAARPGAPVVRRALPAQVLLFGPHLLRGAPDPPFFHVSVLANLGIHIVSLENNRQRQPDYEKGDRTRGDQENQQSGRHNSVF